MGELFPSKLRNVFEIIKEADATIDSRSFMCAILDSLSKAIYMHKSLFIFQDENSSIQFILKNVKKENTKKYLNYFYSLDPIGNISGPPNELRLTPGAFYKNGIVRLQDTISSHSFLSSEYYNDFYRPQNLYYELMSYLKSRDKLLGLVGIYRPKKANRFSKTDMDLMRTISPYISMAYSNIQLQNKNNYTNAIFEMFEEQFPEGILMFDFSMKLVYQNQKARAFIGDLNKNASDAHKSHRTLPTILLKDCFSLKEEYKTTPGYMTILPKQRMIQLNSKRYSLYSQFFEREKKFGLKKTFMVRINPVSSPKRVNENRIQELFLLTKREVEIIHHIFEGQKNFEIAQNLFISEVTVKNHIRNIFQKIKVKNRTSLMKKLLDVASNH